MAQMYVDAVIGSDANDGSSLSPKATFAAARVAQGSNGAHDIYLRNGQTHLVTSEGQLRGGLNANARSTLMTYGDGPKARVSPHPTWTPGSSTALWWQPSLGAGWLTFDGVVFDAQNRANLDAAFSPLINGAADLSDVLVRNCEFTGGGMGVSPNHTAGLTWAAQAIRGLVFENCDSYRNKRHGWYGGGIDTIIRKCRAFQNGIGDGGHGFSSQGNNATTVTSGWTLVSGTIYERAASPAAVGLWTNLSAYRAPIKNSATPATPAPGEWSNFGGAVRINIGQDPSGVSVTYTQIPQGIVYEECEAFENAAFAPYAFVEGSGFQSDDFSSGLQYIRCLSRNNSGGGFAFNNAADGLIDGCVAFGNSSRGISFQNSCGIIARRSAVIGNNRGGRRYPDAALSYPGEVNEVALYSSPNITLAGLDIVCRQGLQAAIYVNDARSAFGSSANTIRASGAAAMFAGAASLSGSGRTMYPHQSLIPHPAAINASMFL